MTFPKLHRDGKKVAVPRDGENDLNTHFLAPNAEGLSSNDTDPLSQVLSLVRLQGDHVFVERLTCEGRVIAKGNPRFYVVQGGRLRVHMTSGTADLAVGDVLLLPDGGAHVVSAMSPDEAHPMTPARYIVGIFRIEQPTAHPVLAALPALVHVQNQGVAPAWVAALSRFMVEESSGHEPGAQLMVSRLIDLLVIRALRTWSLQSGTSFAQLASIGDDRLGRALSALHAAPVHPWTVPELAAVATMSRSSFARHFAASLGEPPLRYLARWRLHLASDLLRSGAFRVGDVASRVGYASEAAFSRAYKACFGHSPKQALSTELQRIESAASTITRATSTG